MKIAVLDDYQTHALELADWSPLQRECEIKVFNRNLRVPDEAAAALFDFDVICLVRERMPVPRGLIERLPRLKFIAATGPHNRTIDFTACAERGILVSHTTASQAGPHATTELTWGLILSAARQIAREDREMRQGGWQTSLGTILHGKTLGLLGFGTIGRQVALVGRAFGMEIVAWSENLTDERASAGGAKRVSKEDLFRQSDVLSIHLVLSERTRGTVAASELHQMKPGAIIVNTARGAIIRQSDLVQALLDRRIACAALDVYEEEPLPRDHVLRTLPNVVLSPHLGYVTREGMSRLYADTVENISCFLRGEPIRLLTSGLGSTAPKGG